MDSYLPATSSDNSVQIVITGQYSFLLGDYPRSPVLESSSYPVEGAQYSKAFKRGSWDGRKHLFSERTRKFPTGLLPDVKLACESAGCRVSVEDQRERPKTEDNGFDLIGITLRDYQLDACNAAVAASQGILKLATGAGKTAIGTALIRHYGVVSLFLVPGRELLYQTQKSLESRLGYAVGLVGDGHWDPKKVTVATVDTVHSRMDTAAGMEWLSSVQLVIVDEAHSTGSDTVFEVLAAMPAYFRFGLSATPLDRTDGANLRLIGMTGPLLIDIRNKFLVERRVLPWAQIVFSSVTSPKLPKRRSYAEAYKTAVAENENMHALVVEWAKACTKLGLSTLILVEQIGHGNRLDEALWNDTDDVFVPHKFIHGSDTGEDRDDAIEAFGDRRLPVLICSTVADQGLDVATVDVLILAGSRKSRIKTMQRLGRGLRGTKLIVIEFANYCSDYLLRHSMERLQDYKAEDCFGIHKSQPSVEVLRKLWKLQEDRLQTPLVIA